MSELDRAGLDQKDTDPRELGVATLEVDGYQYWLVGCDYPAEGIRKVWFERGAAGEGEGEVVYELTEALTGRERARTVHGERTLELAVQVLDGFIPDTPEAVAAERALISARQQELTAQGVPSSQARLQARSEWLRVFLAG